MGADSAMDMLGVCIRLCLRAPEPLLDVVPGWCRGVLPGGANRSKFAVGFLCLSWRVRAATQRATLSTTGSALTLWEVLFPLTLAGNKRGGAVKVSS